MSGVITISNGSEFLRISPDDFADAQREGFYRPVERGLTIVGNGREVFEIPLGYLPSALNDGYRDLLSAERATNGRPRSLVHAPALSSAAPAAALGAGDTPIEVEMVEECVNQAELEEEQARLEREQALAETEGWRWYALWTRFWLEQRREILLEHMRNNSISIAIHLAILLLLASLVMKTETDPPAVIMASNARTDEIVEEIVIQPQPLEVTEPTETTETESPPEAEEVAMEMTEAVEAPDFMAAVSGDAVKAPAMPSNDPGLGKEMPNVKPTFFGASRTAVDYVFVIDNSNSMTGGRFETALHELMLAVNRLTPRQRFFVIFYSDTAYPMMHPNPVKDLVAATPKNKQALYQWLLTVQLCLKTNGKEAIQMAFDLDPDIIYVLGDGAFTDKAAEYFSATPQRKIPLHTRGMEVNPGDAKSFEMLAKKNGGDYKDVGVHPIGQQVAKQNPRPRNTAQGPIWGIKLKPAPKF